MWGHCSNLVIEVEVEHEMSQGKIRWRSISDNAKISFVCERCGGIVVECNDSGGGRV